MTIEQLDIVYQLLTSVYVTPDVHIIRNTYLTIGNGTPQVVLFSADSVLWTSLAEPNYSHAFQ